MTVITRLRDSGVRWLPGQLLNALAYGGTSATTYTHTVVVLSMYAAIIAAATLMLFQRCEF